MKEYGKIYEDVWDICEALDDHKKVSVIQGNIVVMLEDEKKWILDIEELMSLTVTLFSVIRDMQEDQIKEELLLSKSKK